MQNTKCPLCNSDIIIEDEAYEGDLVNCVNCEAELEISSLHPLNLSLLEAEKGTEESNEKSENNDKPALETDHDIGRDDMDEE